MEKTVKPNQNNHETKKIITNFKQYLYKIEINIKHFSILK